MKIGTVKEIITHEYRVGLTPNAARSYLNHGHQVFVEKTAGEGSAYPDEMYEKVGCTIVDSAQEVFANCDMIVKVKEPQKSELPYLRENQIVYTYFHLAADKELTEALLEKKCNSVAYETITDDDGGLPCLKPMSQIAGRLAIHEGAKYLEKTFGGRGVLLSGVPGVLPAEVVILGAGVVGMNAVKVAIGMGANVTVLDIDLKKLEMLEDLYFNQISTLFSSDENVKKMLKRADLVIGAVLKPGGATPKLIKRAYLQEMKPGSLIVDIAIDQGGCSETSRKTYHDDPVYFVDGVLHYCVGNMPGAVSNTSTNALNNATLAFGLKIADLGLIAALQSDDNLLNGLNTYQGYLTCEGVAKAHGLTYSDPRSLLK